MYSTWAPLQTVLDSGPHYILDDQRIWTGPIEEFAMACKLVSPMRAELDIFQQEDGLLVRGKIAGRVTLPCNRCAEDAECDIDTVFDSFESFPPEDDAAEPDSDVDEYFLRRSPQGTGLEINLGALVWEEFAQALPIHLLCSPDCAGLCAKCGTNLNQGACGCAQESSDPRLEKLRGLKIKK
ncbi:MAG: DUF177 domain-containing protein [Deltaproteobacteria bacterium]|nr:DUF177 domain-containing protein [Deltaproteobacteria bacterium]